MVEYFKDQLDKAKPIDFEGLSKEQWAKNYVLTTDSTHQEASSYYDRHIKHDGQKMVFWMEMSAKKLEIKIIHESDIDNLATTYEFVRYAGTYPVFKLKENNNG